MAGGDFLGGTLGKTVIKDSAGVTTSVEVEIRKKCYQSKTESEIAGLTNYITTMLEQYINPSPTAPTLTENIQSWSRERVPPVGQLYYSEVIPESFSVENVINPFAADSNKPPNKYYPDVSRCSCGRPPFLTFQF